MTQELTHHIKIQLETYETSSLVTVLDLLHEFRGTEYKEYLWQEKNISLDELRCSIQIILDSNGKLIELRE